MRIIICPDFDSFYYSFYLQGIRDAFPNAAVVYSSKPFPMFSTRCLAMILVSDGQERRLIIDCTDGTDIRPVELKWCDIYGKVNWSAFAVPEDASSKVIPIGPSFGVQIWNPVKALSLAGLTWLIGRKRLHSVKEHLANYRRQYKYRLPEKQYARRIATDPHYIFHLSSLWLQAPETNTHRAVFIEACRSLPGLTFEGGFAPPLPGHDVKGFEDKQVARRYCLPEWIEKTERSCLVFNTPAVFQCHGWKLSEYLALGKAIISMPLIRELPSPLVHGTHIHYVDQDPESMKKAINLIVNDDAYRTKLEHNARDYYCSFLRPGIVVDRLFRRATAASLAPQDSSSAMAAG